MTVLDFFQNQCAETPQSNTKFYIVDDRNQTPAYTTTEKFDEKITEVENPNGKNVVFTPIDHCLITGNNPKRCDGMLTGEKFLFLVEIKDRKRKRFAGAKKEAKEQLTQTIALLRKTHPDLDNLFPKRKAYFSFVRIPGFVRNIKHSEKEEFKEQTGFIFVINTRIIIE